MGWFKNWKKKRNEKKNSTKEIRHPDSSYDIYNQSETLTLQTELNKDLLVAYDNSDDLSIEQTNTSLNDKSSSKKDSSASTTKTRTTTVGKTRTTSTSTKTRTTTIKKGEDVAKGRNIYYVSARKDKDGKKIGWEVKKENADKITKLCKTKEEATEFVREKAGNQGSTCIIRKLDGSIDKTIKFDTNKK